MIKLKMHIKIFKIQTECDIFLFIFFTLIFFIGYIGEYLIIFMSMAFHELAHALAAEITGRKINLIRILPIGLNVLIDGQEYRLFSNMAIYFSGPFLNIFLCILGLAISPFEIVKTEYMNFFIISNLYLSIFNLLPVLPLDGGKILNLLLSYRYGLNKAFAYTRRVSFFLTFHIIIVGAIELIISKYNFSLLIIGMYFIYYLRTERMEGALMNIKYLISRRSRLIKKGIYPARDLVVIQSIRIGEVLKNMDFDRFHFVHVLDEKMKVVKVFTEQEVIDEMMEHSTDVTFGELVRKGEVW